MIGRTTFLLITIQINRTSDSGLTQSLNWRGNKGGKFPPLFSLGSLSLPSEENIRVSVPAIAPEEKEGIIW